MIDWIDCKDRLPEVLGPYLFLIKELPPSRGKQPRIGYYIQEEKHWQTIGYFFIEGEVTHWAEINYPKKLSTAHEALGAYREGKRIRRKKWNKNFYLKTSHLLIPPPDYYTLENFIYDDWEIVE